MESAARETQRRVVFRDLYQLAGRPSVRELADATGLSRSTVHRVVTGDSSAGMRKVAEGLAARLAPDAREAWTTKITNVFEEPVPGVEDTTPFRALHASEREMVTEAFSEFERSLQRVRNLIAHGQVQTSPEVSATVMLMAATMEHARSGRYTHLVAEGAAQYGRAAQQEQPGGEAPASDSAGCRKDDA